MTQDEECEIEMANRLEIDKLKAQLKKAREVSKARKREAWTYERKLRRKNIELKELKDELNQNQNEDLIPLAWDMANNLAPLFEFTKNQGDNNMESPYKKEISEVRAIMADFTKAEIKQFIDEDPFQGKYNFLITEHCLRLMEQEGIDKWLDEE